MPSVSNKQKRFFGAVMGAKKTGKGSGKAKSAAKSMTKAQIKDFLESADPTGKSKMLTVLKKMREQAMMSPQDTNMLDEESTNPIAKTFVQKNVKFEDYIGKFVGVPFQPKELEAITHYEEQKPTKTTAVDVRYETTNSFGQNTTTLIKKLREGNQFSFTAFQKFSQPNQPEQTPDAAGGEEAPAQDEVTVNKSISYDDEIKGAAILIDFLNKLDI